MPELRWWLLETSDGMRTSVDGVRFDVWQVSGPTASRIMAWAEEHYEAVTTERVYEDEER